MEGQETMVKVVASLKAPGVAAALGTVAVAKPAAVAVIAIGASFGGGGVIVVGVIAGIAIFGSEKRRDRAMDVLKALFGRK
jgi:glucose uptake protein GlcU